MECGCGVFIADENALQGLGDTVKHCPMHEAAGDMLAALDAEDELQEHIKTCHSCKQVVCCDEIDRTAHMADKLRPAAIAAARGGAA